ncbi:hypothetical protein XELAEV_18026358mg [Xenopus laevis]|uniref:MAM domain-containing glycosylphosphatidylinositol anchor protein 1 n=1 Tax=Xenopus laevis TaxID=8355 RepID=A0A974HIS0_XENLA|nr:hypothetical protein XELAEV_18026358mg [Xenopus laevis]
MHTGFTMRCNLLKGSPLKLATAVWRYNTNLLNVDPTEQQEYSELRINSLTQKTSGTYECTVSNDVGSDSCVFQVTGKALSPEFYYDTPSPIKVFKQFRNYSYLLQWTQKEPGDVDPITSYRLEYRQTNLRNIMIKDIPVRGIQKGQLQQYLLTDLKANQSYEVQLTPYTSFGTGDSASRIIQYTERYYMFIEASPPRVPGEKARLISPMYNVSTKPPYHRTPFCVSFYYHMYGRHIGNLNLLMRTRSKGTMDTQVWSLRGDRGNRWQHAMVPMSPMGPFQVVFEGVRGSGIEGDIAIDDVTVRKGDCPWKQLPPTKDVIPPGSPACKVFAPTLNWALAFFLFVLLR